MGFAVVEGAEGDEVVEVGGSSVGSVDDVMDVDPAGAAASWEAAVVQADG